LVPAGVPSAKNDEKKKGYSKDSVKAEKKDA